MTHARTLPRYVGAAGLVAGLLVAFPSLSHAATGPYTITELKLAVQRLSSPMNVSTPPNVPGDPSTAPPFRANARVSLRDAPGRRPLGGTPIYTTIATEIPRSTVRAGALSALGRGVMHPGFQIALIAAGYLLLNNDIFIHQYDNVDFQDLTISGNVPSSSSVGSVSTNCGGFPNYIGSLAGAISHCSGLLKANNNWDFSSIHFANSLQGYFYYTDTAGGGRSHAFSIVNSAHQLGEEIVTLQNGEAPLIAVDLNTHDFSNVDQHIPPQLVEELWNGEPIPEWQDAITVLGPPATWVQPTGEQAVVPEVARAAGRWAENVLAQLNGQSAPNPDAPVTSNTSVEQYYEERLDDDGPPPSFSDVDIDWQVEEIDQLPPYDIGIGSGQCPPPTVITLPFPLNSTLTLNWQPFCDLAAMIRGAVIAVAMILSLYIVLRRG